MSLRRVQVWVGSLACLMLWAAQPLAAWAQADGQARRGKADKKRVVPLRAAVEPRLPQQEPGHPDAEVSPVQAAPTPRLPEAPQEPEAPLELKGVRG